MKLIRNGFIRNLPLLIPRVGLDSVSITEIGDTGFGDRLRGIGAGLFLARYHRVSVLYYDDRSKTLDFAKRDREFPFEMCDLISLNGIELRKGSPPTGARCLRLCHITNDASKLTLLGYKSFWRLEPSCKNIGYRLRDLKVGRDCIGFHVRGTDALDTSRFFDGVEVIENRAIDNLRAMSRLLGTKKLFLAADSQQSQESWIARLTQLGFDVIFNSSVQWRVGELRGTGAEDMLIDFFGLARCNRIVRLVPSEFSRFAAWKSGRMLRYNDLF